MPVERKRPWYLVLALLGALALGMTATGNGWAAWELYREPVDMTLVGQGIADPADRAVVESRVEAYVRVLDGAKGRGWPIAVGVFLLGSTMMILAMRALGGSGGARAALVQVVVAQGMLNVAGYWLLRDVIAADTRCLEATEVAYVHQNVADRSMAEQLLGVLGVKVALARARNPVVGLALSTLGSMFVLVALTRRRSREFFDASAAAVEER